MTDHDLRLGPIGQVARHVSDTAAAVAWYRDVLGLPHLFTAGDLAFFDCGGVRLLLSAGEGGTADGTADGDAGATPQTPSVLYFRVDDIQAAAGTLAERGVRFVAQPHLIFTHPDGTQEWMAFFVDPDEQLLALMSQVRGTSADG